MPDKFDWFLMGFTAGGTFAKSATARSVAWSSAKLAAAPFAAVAIPFTVAAARAAAIPVGIFGAGYALGAAVGTGLAYAGWGESGAQTAVDVYTYPDLFVEALTSVPENLSIVVSHLSTSYMDKVDPERHDRGSSSDWLEDHGIPDPSGIFWSIF
jgi:hypothetical protein